MRPFLLITLTALLLTTAQGQASGRPASQRADEAELIRLAHQLIDAQRRYDTALMEKILDESYVEISPVGSEDLRSDVLGFYGPEEKKAAADGGVEIPPMLLDETRATVAGALGRLTARETLSMGGATRSLRLTLHFRKTRLGWRILTAQYTPIREPRP